MSQTYKVVDTQWTQSSPGSTEAILNSMGAAGWQLADIYLDMVHERARLIFTQGTSSSGSGGLSSTLVKVTSAQLLALHTTPVVLIPAQTGFAIIPVHIACSFLAGTIAYANIGSPNIVWHGTSNAPVPNLNVGYICGGTTNRLSFGPMTSAGYDEATVWANLSIDLVDTGSTWTAGNGALDVTLVYYAAPIA